MTAVFLHDHVGLLQVVVDGEQDIAFLHLVAFADFQRLHPSLLIRRNENQLGFNPALQYAVIVVAASGKHEHGGGGRQHFCNRHLHVVLRAENSRSRCVFIILRTSSGSKRSNSPLQMIASMPGAAIICGNSASPSGTSPRAAARRSRDRTAAMMRERTSR